MTNACVIYHSTSKHVKLPWRWYDVCVLLDEWLQLKIKAQLNCLGMTKPCKLYPDVTNALVTSTGVLLFQSRFHVTCLTI